MQARIVIIEDNYRVLSRIRRLIEELGHIVVGDAARTGKAIFVIEEKKPDLVFLDIQLADSDVGGFEIASFMNKKYPHIPYIFLSVSEDKPTRWKGADIAGEQYSYIRKNIDLGDLDEYIEYKLRKYLPQRFLNSAIQTAPKEEYKEENEDKMRSIIINGVQKRLSIDDILWIKTFNDKLRGRGVYIYMIQQGKEKEETKTSITLTKCVQLLNHPNIVQIHQSWCVNIQKIEGRDPRGNFVQINWNNETVKLVVGSSFRKIVQSRMNDLWGSS